MLGSGITTPAVQPIAIACIPALGMMIFKEVGLSGACNTRGRNENCKQSFVWKNKGKTLPRSHRQSVSLMLKYTVKEFNMWVCELDTFRSGQG